MLASSPAFHVAFLASKLDHPVIRPPPGFLERLLLPPLAPGATSPGVPTTFGLWEWQWLEETGRGLSAGLGVREGLGPAPGTMASLSRAGLATLLPLTPGPWNRPTAAFLLQAQSVED